MGKGQIPAHAYTGKGIGLKFKENPVAVRFPAPLKAVLDAMGSSEKQDFIRAAVIEKLEREAKLPPAVVAIEPPAPPEPTPKKTTRAKKPMQPYWVPASTLYLRPALLSEEDQGFVRENPDLWFLVQEPKTKISKWLEVKTHKEYEAMKRVERKTSKQGNMPT